MNQWELLPNLAQLWPVNYEHEFSGKHSQDFRL